MNPLTVLSWASTEVDPVRQDDMRVVAALLQDPNPIHWDAEAVSAAGLGNRTINQGVMNLSYLLRFVSASVSAEYRVERFRVRLTANVYESETVMCSAEAMTVDDPSGTAVLKISAAVGDRTVLVGTANLSAKIGSVDHLDGRTRAVTTPAAEHPTIRGAKAD